MTTCPCHASHLRRAHCVLLDCVWYRRHPWGDDWWRAVAAAVGLGEHRVDEFAGFEGGEQECVGVVGLGDECRAEFVDDPGDERGVVAFFDEGEAGAAGGGVGEEGFACGGDAYETIPL